MWSSTRKKPIMLKGISPVLSPDLLGMLCRMGHGDEIVPADARFPVETVPYGNIILKKASFRQIDLPEKEFEKSAQFN